MKSLRTLAFLLLASAVTSVPPRIAEARVVRVVVDRREPIGGGHVFGTGGPYERIVGKIFIALDPKNPHDTQIVDLALAPRNAQGEVEAWADFVMLRPTTVRQGAGAALIEVVNRGGGGATISTFSRDARRNLSPDSAAYYGDALLMRMGLTVVFLGWQFDVPVQPGLLRLHAPVATDHGRPITGLVRSDWTVDAAVHTLPLGHGVGNSQAIGYPVDNPDAAVNVLTVRDAPLAPRIVVPRAAWRFAREDSGRVVDDRTHIYVPAGFTPGKIYELVYGASDPVVVGTGLAMVRDVISYLKYDSSSIAPVHAGIAYGVSQTGRFLRQFVYQGFNTDEAGRIAFDGMFVHTGGAGRGSFNHRFAQPSRDAQPYSTFFYPTDLFPFTGRAERDMETGREDGLLTHAHDSAHSPKIYYVDGGHEYWGRAASLTHTTTDGTRDIAFLPNERRYVIASAKHSSPSPFPPDSSARIAGSAAYRGNPLQLRFATRALLTSLVAWVVNDVTPPPSAYPTLAARTLVAPTAVRFPAIPNVQMARIPHRAYHVDYGPRWSRGIVDLEPPHVGSAFTVLVTQVDSLGNDADGIRSVELLAPIATYFPWQLRTGYPAATDRLVSFDGTFIPLPRTESERTTSGDPRPSIERLYGDRATYMKRAEAAAQQLVTKRFLLAEDVAPAVQRAGLEWDWVMQH